MKSLFTFFKSNDPKPLPYVKEFVGHEKRVATLAYFKDKLYSGCQDCTIRQWEPDSGLYVVIIFFTF